MMRYLNMRIFNQPQLSGFSVFTFYRHINSWELFNPGNQIHTIGVAQTGTGRDPAYSLGRTIVQRRKKNGNEHAATDR
jgi:hypothetical protein